MTCLDAVIAQQKMSWVALFIKLLGYLKRLNHQIIPNHIPSSWRVSCRNATFEVLRSPQRVVNYYF